MGATETVLRGGMAGAAATVPMTLVIETGRAVGWVRTPPPEQITANVAERAGESPSGRDPTFQAAWLAAHLGYGAACGALFALIRPLLPRPDVAAGLLFGGAVWGVSYLSVLPALELFPPAQDDSPRRQAVMIAAHAVYGLALADLERTLQLASPPPLD